VKQYQNTIIIVSLLCFFFMVMSWCGPAVVVKKPPAPRIDSKPPKPFPKAVWIEGHWKWNAATKQFDWVSGHWIKQKPGQNWVAGY